MGAVAKACGASPAAQASKMFREVIGFPTRVCRDRVSSTRQVSTEIADGQDSQSTPAGTVRSNWTIASSRNSLASYSPQSLPCCQQCTSDAASDFLFPPLLCHRSLPTRERLPTMGSRMRSGTSTLRDINRTSGHNLSEQEECGEPWTSEEMEMEKESHTHLGVNQALARSPPTHTHTHR